jgi:hypothetical protein
MDELGDGVDDGLFDGIAEVVRERLSGPGASLLEDEEQRRLLHAFMRIRAPGVRAMVLAMVERVSTE